MSDLGKFAPPPLRKDQSLFWTMAVRDGQMYAAPLGTPYDLTNESWLKVDSMEQLRKFFGVEPPASLLERTAAEAGLCPRCLHTAHEDIGECMACYCRSLKP